MTDLDALFRSAPTPTVILAADGTVASANEAFLRLVGTSRAILGRDPREALAGAAAVEPGPLLESVARVLASGEPDRPPIRRVDLPGDPPAVAYRRATSYPVRGDDGRVAFVVHQFEDASEPARPRPLDAEHSAATADSDLFRAIYEQGIFAGRLALDGVLLDANRPSLDRCGYRAEDVLGRPFWECGWWNRSAEVQASVRRAVEQAARGEPFRGELPYFLADGTERRVQFACLPIQDESGRVAFLVPTGIDVTDRARAAEHERAAGLLESITDAYLALDRDWRFTYLNREAERLLGRTRFDLVGKVVWEEFPELAESDFAAAYRAAMDEGRTARVEAFYPPHDRWYEVQASPNAGGISLFFRDVTDRRRAEERLRESEERYRTLFNSIDEGFGVFEMIFDRAGAPVDYRFLEANPAFEAQTGLRDAVGRTVGEMVPNLESHWFEIYGRVATTGEPVRFVEHAREMEGRWFDVYAFRLGPPEERKVAVLFTDITARRRAEERLVDQEARFRQIADNLPGGAIFQAVPGERGQLLAFSYLSRGVERLFGYDPDAVLADPSRILAVVDDRDVGMVRTAVIQSMQAGLPFDLQFRARARDGSVKWVHARSAPREAPGGGRVWDGVIIDVTARQRAEQRQVLLAQAGRILGSSLDYDATLSDLCRLVVPTLADWCAVDLVDDSGGLRRVDVAHVDPAKVALAQEFRRRYPPRPEDDQGLMKVVRTGRPEFFPEVTPELIRQGARDEEHARILLDLGLTSGLIVPLTARGRTLGAITLVAAESSRRFDDEDLRLAAELASRAALAVDNARLLREARESALRREEALALHKAMDEQLSALVQGSRRLSQSLDTTDVLDAVLALSRELIAADAYAVWRREPESGRWGIRWSWGLSPEFRGRTIEPDAGAIRSPEGPIVAEDVGASDALEHRRGLYEQEGVRSLLAVPLKVRGRSDGTISFYYRSPHHFDEVELRVASAISNLASSALGSSELYEAVLENDRRKNEFLAMLAHELRNPLSAIGNAAAVARDERDGQARDRALAVIEKHVRTLSRMIEDLLDASRIATGKIRLRRQRVEVAAIAEQAAQTVRPLMALRRHELVVALPSSPTWVEADPHRLEQVAVNLLNNAAKYTPPGGRIELDVEVEAEDGSVVLRVKDDGAGMPPETIPRMFELFAQGDRSIARSEGGLGIGLTLVKSLVEMHGGEVSARSDGPGLGSEFTVRLPAAAAPEPVPPADPAGHRDDPASRFRVLVVDDNEDAAWGLARLLRLKGHEVRTAPDGPTALDLARSEPPEVVLLDLGLPGMDGFEVAARLRADGLADATIVAVSGYGEEAARRRSKEVGFDDHLVKPVRFETLAALLKSLRNPGDPHDAPADAR